ncbi:MAG: hypothetical protein IT579_18995 [Verrucomicrobia subdivision 3 bacterium]|nr:hypothetical protein [Limisphaerales bacterium]
MKRKLQIALGTILACGALTLYADVREGMVAYWPLNTASGAYPMTTPDVVAGNDLVGPTMDSATMLVPGQFGNAVTFDGASTYLTFQAPPDSDTGLPVSKKGSWSISVWVNGAAQAGGNYYFVESSSINNNPLTALIARANTNTTAVYFRDASGGNPVNLPAVTNISLNSTWHHVALTYDALSRAFLHYVDGSLVYSNSFVPNYANSSVNDLVNLGARNRNGVVDLFFAGKVDDLALWARALSQAEVQDVIANGIVTPVPQFAPTVSSNPSSATNLYPGDSYTLKASVYGSRPLYYQWQKDEQDIPGATLDTFALADVTTATNGNYRLIVTNSTGSATSTVAQVTVNSFGGVSLTNGLVAYWPLNTIAGVKTPDLVSAYDLTVNNMGSSNVVAGKWGNALAFDKTFSQYARRIHNSGDALPAYSKSNFTVSFWAKAPIATGGGWAFTESRSDGNNNTAFCMGLFNNSNPGLDGFVRSDAGQPSGDHRISVTPVWDDAWHNVVWVQHDAGGVPKASLYIDGVLDTANNLNPVYPVTPNNTALASFARATPGQFYTGLIDEVAIWERPLSPAEITLLQTGPITNPPSRLTPLAISSYKADLAAVVSGDSTVLRWDVPANVTSAFISNIGDVTAKTAAGGGVATNLVTVTNTTTYTLTITRGSETVSKSVTVGAVNGVASGWSLVDNFDFYQVGPVGTNGTWLDMYGNTVAVTQPANQNRLAKVTAISGAGGAYLKLNGLTFTGGQARTLFFRMIPKGNPVDAIKQAIGLSDRTPNFYYQVANQANMGPVIYPAVNSAEWQIGVSTNGGGGTVYDPTVLTVDAVYKVWIDITNAPIVNEPGARVEPDEEDVYSVYIQKEGDANRTALFVDCPSDRKLNSMDEFTTDYPSDTISRLYLVGNSDTEGALYDDIYLSKNGILATTPIGAGYAGAPPTLEIKRSGNQWEILFQGKLLEAASVNGPWTDVAGATSPYPVTTTGGPKFYRAVSN